MDSSSTSNPRSIATGNSRLPGSYVVRSPRERVLEAMVRVAAAKGYEATTTADVLEFAGVSEDAFFEMFDNKTECFLEAYDAIIDVLIAYMTRAFEEAGAEPWPQKIAAALGAMVELLSAEAEIARMAMVEVTAAGDDARERYRAAIARLGPFLEEGRTYSGQDDALPADTARLAIGAVVSMVFDEVRAGRGPELQRILPDLVFAVLMPYLGSEAADDETRRLTA